MGIDVVDGVDTYYFRLGIMRVRLPLATRGTPGRDLLAGARLRDDYAGDRYRRLHNLAPARFHLRTAWPVRDVTVRRAVLSMGPLGPVRWHSANDARRTLAPVRRSGRQERKRNTRTCQEQCELFVGRRVSRLEAKASIMRVGPYLSQPF